MFSPEQESTLDIHSLDKCINSRNSSNLPRTKLFFLSQLAWLNIATGPLGKPSPSSSYACEQQELTRGQIEARPCLEVAVALSRYLVNVYQEIITTLHSKCTFVARIKLLLVCNCSLRLTICTISTNLSVRLARWLKLFPDNWWPGRAIPDVKMSKSRC